MWRRFAGLSACVRGTEAMVALGELDVDGRILEGTAKAEPELPVSVISRCSPYVHRTEGSASDQGEAAIPCFGNSAVDRVQVLINLATFHERDGV